MPHFIYDWLVTVASLRVIIAELIINLGFL